MGDMTKATRKALEAMLSDSGSVEKLDPIRESQASALERVRRECIQECGLDPADTKMDFRSARFSGKKFVEGMQTHYNMSETVAYSSLAAFARYGIQSTLFDLYNRESFDWRPLVTLVPSKSASEFFSVAYEGDLPERVGDNEEAPESRMNGRNFEVVNHDYARILRVPKKLIADDQTGQIIRRAEGFGRGSALTEYKEAVSLFTKRSTWTTSGAQDITQPAIEQAWTKLRQSKDPSGEFLIVNPNLILVDVTRELRTRKLVESLYQSAIPFADDTSNPPVAAPPGQPGYFMTENVLRDMKFKVVGSPFINQSGSSFGTDGVSPKWYLMEAGKGVIMTDREPLSVTQEDPNSGMSWSTRSLAWQINRRFGMGILDDLYIYAGNG